MGLAHGEETRMKTTARHPADMTGWAEIACQRGHKTHDASTVAVDLSKPHGYHDLPAVSSSLAFSMQVFDWEDYGEGPYCPGHDTVSETIATLGIWEPAETVLALKVCAGHAGERMVDLGAQIGWFSLLALAQGLEVDAIDADPEPLRLLRESASLNDWGGRLCTSHRRLGPDMWPFAPGPAVRFAKVDVEGAENEAIRILMPSLRRGRVEHLCVEVSPVFADYYPAMLRDLMDLGYVAYLLPGKQTPPARLEDPEWDLRRLTYRDLESIPSQHQLNIWLRHVGASW